MQLFRDCDKIYAGRKPHGAGENSGWALDLVW